MNEESKRYLWKAQRSLKVSAELLAEGYYEDSCSKSYYSMFYAAQALLKPLSPPHMRLDRRHRRDTHTLWYCAEVLRVVRAAARFCSATRWPGRGGHALLPMGLR